MTITAECRLPLFPLKTKGSGFNLREADLFQPFCLPQEALRVRGERDREELVDAEVKRAGKGKRGLSATRGGLGGRRTRASLSPLHLQIELELKCGAGGSAPLGNPSQAT